MQHLRCATSIALWLFIFSGPVEAGEIPTPEPSPTSSAVPRVEPREEPVVAQPRTSSTEAASSAEARIPYQELLAGQRDLDERLKALASASATQRQRLELVEPPLAGYSDKSFFLRDQTGNFVLVPKGRVNVDYYHFLNRGDLPSGAQANGPTDPRPKDTMFIRRARVGFAGTLAKLVDFRFEVDAASQATAGQYGTVTDASVVFNSNPYLQVEVGQFYAPFTLENPTSEVYTDFMEKAAAVRFAVPNAREIGLMVQGKAPRGLASYWVGVFNGDGQNLKNLDNRAAVIGRATVSPFAFAPQHEKWLEEVWVGGSFWTQKTSNPGGAAAASTSGATSGDLSSFTTQSGWTVFGSSFANGKDAAGSAIRSHLAPSGNITKYAFELNLPFRRRAGARLEYLHQSIDIQQYDDVNAAGIPSRSAGPQGTLTGSGGYGEIYVWLGHDVNVDRPGLYQPPHWRGYVPPPLPTWAVMLAAKYEHVGFDVDGLSTAGSSTPNPAVGHYALDVFELGANAWYTRHARFSINYVLNHLGAGDGVAPTVLSKNFYYKKSEHELVLRWAASL
jgi:hypothetical protein